jgi:anti-sigma factor RsiW
MMKSSSKHLTFARLADLAEGRLTAEELAAARGHLGGCADCSRQAEELQRVTGLMRADTTEDAPRDVLFNAIRMFRSRPPVAAETPSLLRRLVASLSFDSGARTPAFGLRSGAAAAARQLLFSAGDLDVDLRLAPSGEGWAVSGQVLGECAAGRVELFAEGDGGPAASADLNDLCEFTLPTVPAGTYALRLTLGDAEIEVPGLSLQA